MAYSAKILADSITNAGCRLTTMEVTYPRIIHSEYMTHRVKSRNAASTRAIPVSKTISKVLSDPFIPFYWGKNQKGMVADQELSAEEIEIAKAAWLQGRDDAVKCANALVAAGVHKQIAGRVLEPFQYITVITSSTEWTNFFNLRCAPDAAPEIRKIAEMMKALYDTSIPAKLATGMWHTPMCEDKIALLNKGYSATDIRKIAVGRIARISYETHDGRKDPEADLALANTLLESKHNSPWEHVARAESHDRFVRNFRGWTQFRALVDGD